MNDWSVARRIATLAVAAATVLAAPVAGAQVSQFAIVGHIESFKLRPGTDPLRGATMRVAGTEIVLPANMRVQMPTKFLTPVQIFNQNPKAPGGITDSGLAIDDSAAMKPLAAYEASVAGNIVNGAHIAGLVSIAQLSLGVGAGVIKSIRADGTLVVGAPGALSPADARVKLNDPEGRFGAATTDASVDFRFAVDADNPSVHSATGFPMCIPRSAADAQCPASNRPAAAGTLFVMDTVALPPSPADGPPIVACPGCDRSKQAPFKVGDTVNYSGVLARDAAGLYVSAHTLAANVGIYTGPGKSPAYTMIEVSLVGTRGPRTPRPGAAATGPFLPQETQDRFKIEGWSTDPSRAIDLYAVDMDPVTGAQTLRAIGATRPEGVPFGRFRHIVGKRAGILFGALTAANPTGVRGATRELMVRVNDNTDLTGLPVPDASTTTPVANGLVAGQYVAPVGEYIFPENTVMGDPLVPNNFECLAFLQLGSGPLEDDGTGPVVGRLNPWPGGPGAPTALDCGP
jgi:hypothetical protein